MLFTRSSSPSSFLVNSNTTRPIGRGGLVVGTVVDSVPMRCRNLLASSSLRSLSSRYGVQIFSLDICYYSCLRLPSLYPTSIASTQLYYVGFLILALDPTLLASADNFFSTSNSLATPVKTDSRTFVFHQAKETTTLERESSLLISPVYVVQQAFYRSSNMELYILSSSAFSLL